MEQNTTETNQIVSNVKFRYILRYQKPRNLEAIQNRKERKLELVQYFIILNALWIISFMAYQKDYPEGKIKTYYF